jgi:hypothetical protein
LDGGAVDVLTFVIAFLHVVITHEQTLSQLGYKMPDLEVLPPEALYDNSDSDV